MEKRKKEHKTIDFKGKKVKAVRYEGDDTWVVEENKNGS